MRKLLIMLGFLAFAGVSLAGAKSYEFLLPTAAQAGRVTLAAGQYRLQVEGSTAVFTNVRSKERFVVPVRIDNTSKQEPSPLDMKIAMTRQAGVQRIDTIILEDTNSTLAF